MRTIDFADLEENQRLVIQTTADNTIELSIRQVNITGSEVHAPPHLVVTIERVSSENSFALGILATLTVEDLGDVPLTEIADLIRLSNGAASIDQGFSALLIQEEFAGAFRVKTATVKR